MVFAALQRAGATARRRAQRSRRRRSCHFGFWHDFGAVEHGHSVAACAFSPHRPQPTQPSMTVATGSTFSGSGLSFTVSVGQPDRRMQAWSPLQTSSSTPYFTRITRLPRLQQVGHPRLDAALPLELAFALGNDHLQAVESVREGLVQRLAHLVDVVGVDRAQPLHAEALQRRSRSSGWCRSGSAACRPRAPSRRRPASR